MRVTLIIDLYKYTIVGKEYRLCSVRCTTKISGRRPSPVRKNFLHKKTMDNGIRAPPLIVNRKI